MRRIAAHSAELRSLSSWTSRPVSPLPVICALRAGGVEWPTGSCVDGRRGVVVRHDSATEREKHEKTTKLTNVTTEIEHKSVHDWSDYYLAVRSSLKLGGQAFGWWAAHVAVGAGVGCRRLRRRSGMTLCKPVHSPWPHAGSVSPALEQRAADAGRRAREGRSHVSTASAQALTRRPTPPDPLHGIRCPVSDSSVPPVCPALFGRAAPCLAAVVLALLLGVGVAQAQVPSAPSAPTSAGRRSRATTCAIGATAPGACLTVNLLELGGAPNPAGRTGHTGPARFTGYDVRYRRKGHTQDWIYRRAHPGATAR